MLGKASDEDGLLSLEYLATLRRSCLVLRKLAHLGTGCGEGRDWTETEQWSSLSRVDMLLTLLLNE